MNTENTFLVGKYTLESLTSGLYLTPLDLYREYVQNATDAIDQAIGNGQLKIQDAQIIITVRSEESYIAIEDNGTGVASEECQKTLLNIGNSQKDYKKARGFRGIGRLIGLGYCDKLVFTTTSIGEDKIIRIEFNSKELQSLLSPLNNDLTTAGSVLQRTTFLTSEPAKTKEHFFRVELFGAKNVDGLLDRTKVLAYLQQNLPVPFSKEFTWGSLIKQKLSINGYKLAEYNIALDFNNDRKLIYKPYNNSILSDRVRRIKDPIADIHFKTFNVKDELCAVLWYAETNYYGTILDDKVRGIRLRHGNIMFGNQNSLRPYFKEERFDGWLSGELHIVSDQIIPNTRRDDFEKNDAYQDVLKQFKEWSADISKTIRSVSYRRSLSEKEQLIVSSDNDQEVARIMHSLKGEDELSDLDESDEIANIDLFSKLSLLAGTNKPVTKYKALNINSSLTNEEKQTIEHVFDILYKRLTKGYANKVVRTILSELD